jgi:hypothetical protein
VQPVSDQKRVLIVTDGDPETLEMADKIAESLEDVDVVFKRAIEFRGNDLFGVDVFFVGCVWPSPPTFVYVENFLIHVNLAGRRGGVFCTGRPETAAYLDAIFSESEAKLLEEPFIPGPGKNLGRWARDVVTGPRGWMWPGM